ncbi:acyl-CoA N-acyltransferase [Cucurbitaria berberidis CBS 394.84]|uniref:N-alpha-acetyltransferase 40 n=1 Tax=Cucurbitaria berberidis CBS 394.84 TaxID=1168544 RepID=A0A9P4L8W0_9PLEO|nr:acyl-CoA N-acyltransferase [Cucurbitaria berberidis CBS 394.84]KAF1845599.1 acyl-CoA N-acyltransferase [Cucurbitaria berberidis CBS 394.84]
MPHVVRRATEVQKLLEQDATGLHAYEAPQLVCPLKFQLIRSAAALKKSEIDTCLGLVEQTSGHVYRASSIGWHPRKKKEEMMDKEMIYLLVRQGDLEWPLPSNNGRILGFVSFMFTYDDPPYEDREVVYMYEIHLHERLRGRGLGSNLIKFVEHAARYCGISKVMLTVFTANEGAKALYEKLGYTEDICSPTDRIMRNKVVKPDFLIMSKEIAYAL